MSTVFGSFEEPITPETWNTTLQSLFEKGVLSAGDLKRFSTPPESSLNDFFDFSRHILASMGASLDNFRASTASIDILSHAMHAHAAVGWAPAALHGDHTPSDSSFPADSERLALFAQAAALLWRALGSWSAQAASPASDEQLCTQFWNQLPDEAATRDTPAPLTALDQHRAFVAPHRHTTVRAVRGRLPKRRVLHGAVTLGRACDADRGFAVPLLQLPRLADYADQAVFHSTVAALRDLHRSPRFPALLGRLDTPHTHEAALQHCKGVPLGRIIAYCARTQGASSSPGTECVLLRYVVRQAALAAQDVLMLTEHAPLVASLALPTVVLSTFTGVEDTAFPQFVFRTPLFVPLHDPDETARHGALQGVWVTFLADVAYQYMASLQEQREPGTGAVGLSSSLQGLLCAAGINPHDPTRAGRHIPQSLPALLGAVLAHPYTAIDEEALRAEWTALVATGG